MGGVCETEWLGVEIKMLGLCEANPNPKARRRLTLRRLGVWLVREHHERLAPHRPQQPRQREDDALVPGVVRGLGWVGGCGGDVRTVAALMTTMALATAGGLDGAVHGPSAAAVVGWWLSQAPPSPQKNSAPHVLRREVLIRGH